MKQRKSVAFTSLLLCFAMVLSMCTFLSFGVSAAEIEVPAGKVWNGKDKSTSLSGSGVEGDAYLISTPADWAYFADQINAGVDLDKHYELTADLWLNDPGSYELWLSLNEETLNEETKKASGALVSNGAAELGLNATPIVASTSAKAFTGTFNGGGYTIYGAFGNASNAALFGFVNGATIENLNVSHSAFYSGGSACGNSAASIVSQVSGAVHISNCHVSMCTNGASCAAGGIVGYVNTNGQVYMSKCSFDGNLFATGSDESSTVGGMVGASKTNMYYYFDDCVTRGRYVAVQMSASGLYGYHGTTTIVCANKCVNYADVISYGAMAGGMLSVTASQYSEDRAYHFYNCANYGAIEGVTYAGGCVARLSQQHKVVLNIYNFHSNGTVTAGEGGCAGGLVGMFSQAGANPCTTNIYNCVSEGTVTGTNAGALIANVQPGVDKTTGAEVLPILNGANNFVVGAAFSAAADAELLTKITYAEMSGNLAAINEALNDYAEGKVYTRTDTGTGYTITVTLEKWSLGSSVTYTVTFLNKDGAELEVQSIPENTAATPPKAPAVEAMDFAGWENVATGEIIEDFSSITADLTVRATYKAAGPYTVTFVLEDGTVIDTPQTVPYGGAATAPTPPTIDSYTFVGWDVAFDNIKGNLTVTALYSFNGTYFGGGSGTENDPYLIRNKEQLFDMAAKINDEGTSAEFIGAAYKLMADIDLAGEEWTPISVFTGIFDGNTKTISNLYIASDGVDLGFFVKAQGTIKNLTFEDASICMSRTTDNGRGVFVANCNSGELSFENCHVIDGQVRGNTAGLGLFVGYTSAAVTIRFSNCTASGEIFGSANCNQGGFIGGMNSGSAVTSFENCVSSVVINGQAENAGGFIGGSLQSGCDATFTNCIFNGSITMSVNPAGGFVGQIHNRQTHTFTGCTSIGTVSSATGKAGGIVGQLSSSATANMTNCAVYGSVSTETGYAGGIMGACVSSNVTSGVEYMVVLADVSCAEGGFAGAVVGCLYGAGTYQNIFTTGAVFVGTTTDGNTATVTATTIASVTELHAALDTKLWTVGAAPKVSGASLSLGDTIAINLYAKYTIVLKAHEGKLYHNGEFVTAGAHYIDKDGTEYVKFVFDAVKPYEMDSDITFCLMQDNKLSFTYSIVDYVVNLYTKYGVSEVPEAMDNLLVAMVYYGHAAQLAQGGESTVIESLVAAMPALEAKLPAGYIEDKYQGVTLRPAAASGLTVGLNLGGNIQPVFKVEEGITRIKVTIYGETTSINVKDGVAVFIGLNTTSLNNAMTVTLYEGDTAVLTTEYAISNYILDGVAGSILTDNQKTLAKALAVYMRAARDFKGLN